jgi:hypothetical protein
MLLQAEYETGNFGAGLPKSIIFIGRETNRERGWGIIPRRIGEKKERNCFPPKPNKIRETGMRSSP